MRLGLEKAAPGLYGARAGGAMHVLDELNARGFVKQCSDTEALRAKMDAGPVVYYAGFDPTADSLHVGNLLPIMMMAHLQRAGHTPIVVVGGGTGMVGDPSGKTEARMLLDADAIRHNVDCQRKQIARFLDLSAESGARLVDNAEWLLELSYISFLREIGSCFSVNRMLSAEGYKQRMEKGLSFIEFNYQILQAYDFLVLNQRYGCALQIGGDDQWGNILAGLDLIRRKQEAQAFALTLPLLTTASGQKMGKTHSGAVWLDAGRFSPFDMYQFWYGTDDRDVTRFLRLFTFLDLEEIGKLDALQGADLREAKRLLAYEATKLVHGVEAADAARAGAQAMVSNAASDALPTCTLTAAAGVLLANVLAEAGLAPSASEGRRLIQGGGVKVGDAKVSDPKALFDFAAVGPEGVVLRVGKAKAARVVLG